MSSQLASACRSALGGLVMGLAALSAHATDIYSGTLTLASTDPTQLGRLSRNAIPQDWSGTEAFPGTINTTTTYHYKVLDLNIAALESALGVAYGGFLQVTIESTAATTFLAGYLNTYNPTSATTLATTWLGDEGGSGDYFGNDPRTFQVSVNSGGHLLLVLNESTTGGGVGLPASILVEGFSDTLYTDLTPVPEPASWLFMASGLALMGGWIRRRSV